jgi:ketosteroid isomerase-like protein
MSDPPAVVAMEPLSIRAFTMNTGTRLTRRLPALVVPLMLLAASCTAVRPGDAQPEGEQERLQIERRLQEIMVAAENKDFERLEGYHLYGPTFTKFSGSSPARLDAAATRQLEHDGLASLNGLQMRADGLKIDLFGTVGIATFILNYSFAASGEVLHRKDRSTLVFVRERGDWKIVHEHLSPISTAGEGGPGKAIQPHASKTNRTSSATESGR